MDPRYERTEKNLIEACLELGKKRPIRSLSVKEVTEKARINRITFYSHYSNMDDLANHVEDLAIAEWFAYVSPVTDYIYDTEAFIRKSLRFTEESRLGHCLAPDAYENYRNRVYEALRIKLQEETGRGDAAMQKRLYFALHGSASLFSLGLIRNDQDLQETAALIRSILNN